MLADVRWKHALVVAVAVLVGIFILQNTRSVELRLLFWTIEMSRSIMLFVVLGVGVLLGWLLATVQRS